MVRFLAILAVLGLIVFGAWKWEDSHFRAPGPAPSQTVVMVTPGQGLSTISHKLVKAGVVNSARLFELGVWLRHNQSALKAGEYAIQAHASEVQIMDLLVSGKSIQHKITAAEGLTSQMIYNLVKADPVLVGDAGAVPAEGTLLPETYLFTRGVTRKDMLTRMASAQKKLLDELWSKRTKDLPFTTRAQALVLASIVEKETSLPAERRHIAAVFENRLRKGMLLQSDPTIIYGLTKGYPLGRGIRQSELTKATPYNTYVVAGLPPTPICNPGRDSIAAVLNPAQSDDLYFVADGTGGHAFAATMADHARNVVKWRHIEKQDKQKH